MGEKLPEKAPAATPDPQGRRPNQRSGERSAEPQEAQPRREGNAPEKAKEAPDRATEKAREQTDRAQDQVQSLKDQAERKSGMSGQAQPKSTDPDKKKKPATEEPRQYHSSLRSFCSRCTDLQRERFPHGRTGPA